jgi:hypothetical protein
VHGVAWAKLEGDPPLVLDADDTTHAASASSSDGSAATYGAALRNVRSEPRHTKGEYGTTMAPWSSASTTASGKLNHGRWTQQQGAAVAGGTRTGRAACQDRSAVVRAWMPEQPEARSSGQLGLEVEEETDMWGPYVSEGGMREAAGVNKSFRMSYRGYRGAVVLA